MVRVFFPANLQGITAGVRECTVAAGSMRELGAQLEEQFPGIGAHLRAAAVAIDGDVIPGAWLEKLDPESEIHFLPAPSGG